MNIHTNNEYRMFVTEWQKYIGKEVSIYTFSVESLKYDFPKEKGIFVGCEDSSTDTELNVSLKILLSDGTKTDILVYMMAPHPWERALYRIEF